MTVTATLNICNTRGLHARASAKFVKLASSFESEIHVTRDGVTVDARSIMGLLMLGAGIGCSIDVSAEGPDAEEAMEALTDLVARKFDEDQ
ncbi:MULTISPECIES: HPr family phosphocarrier protein [Brevundimonas]|jgi:phosphocarrier protein HPr|uniref:HPr family phosphocarrier protein n=5 Tax=Brevundimonas TaxID=41275 RepID=A0A1Z3U738_BREVE|nr:MULTISPECIES: HPr family phosphocarrier protein [Brevundimonas]MEA3473875.1 HPr family phosphocarrier protein [Pseudomonadota bacterium]ANC54336.1 serine kinase [Brevundimonas sp. GW460-12-10-14-LB2]ASE39081.1 HPr family phosphocarrier protein [Brevundimonas vesicularis]KIC60852.1 serine kinase [Brevundimonas nasdae]KJV41913.1 serine kinase [Brevundimonas sp. KM4]